jgi:hypothetical protein
MNNIMKSVKSVRLWAALAVALVVVLAGAAWWNRRRAPREGFASCPAEDTSDPELKDLFAQLTQAFVTKYSNHPITKALKRGIKFVKLSPTDARLMESPGFTELPLATYNLACGMMLHPNAEEIVRGALRESLQDAGMQDTLPPSVAGSAMFHEIFETYADLVGVRGSKQHAAGVKLLVKEMNDLLKKLYPNAASTLLIEPCYYSADPKRDVADFKAPCMFSGRTRRQLLYVTPDMMLGAAPPPAGGVSAASAGKSKLAGLLGSNRRVPIAAKAAGAGIFGIRAAAKR